ncbi:hypothetical protein [Methylobacter sp.]|uniref:hypothetical protein n=1 Tax=Methylobacter sp. TaxID=2051955 RepID=UPI002FDDF9F6
MRNRANQDQSKLLTDEIKAAEWQVLNRQQLIDFRTNLLVRKIYQQLTDPGSLLLAAGIGFIVSEITKRRPAKVRSTVDKTEKTDKTISTETSPLKVAMNLITSAQTLYTALPLVWLMKSRYQRQDTSAEAAKRKPHPVPSSEAKQNRRRYTRRKPLA